MNCTLRSLLHVIGVITCKRIKKLDFKQETIPKYIHFLSTDIEADAAGGENDFMEGRVKMMMKR
jgi:hypothetical protein